MYSQVLITEKSESDFARNQISVVDDVITCWADVTGTEELWMYNGYKTLTQTLQLPWFTETMGSGQLM